MFSNTFTMSVGPLFMIAMLVVLIFAIYALVRLFFSDSSKRSRTRDDD